MSEESEIHRKYKAERKKLLQGWIGEARTAFRRGCAGYRMPERFLLFYSIFGFIGRWNPYDQANVRELEQVARESGLCVYWECDGYSHTTYDLGSAYSYHAVLYPCGGWWQLFFGRKIHRHRSATA